jgi:Ni,Fe-hydrogenase I cytochrome b subunit
MGLTLMTLLWLIVLTALSGIVMYFSRAANQSWMDEDHIEEHELEVSFDSV